MKAAHDEMSIQPIPLPDAQSTAPIGSNINPDVSIGMKITPTGTETGTNDTKEMVLAATDD